MIERTLARGGMVTVYLAQDSELDRPVALKVLAEHLAGDAEYRARFLREARLVARLVHPNIVQVYDVGEDERGPFIVMEYVEGETLADELRRSDRLPPAEVAELGLQTCAALEAAHAAGLVHRDVKPQNILRARDGTAKLGDFGIARSLDSTVLTEHGSVLGTAAYLAPEQARGEQVTTATDLYALGVVLYEALTGRPPHEGKSLPELLLNREQKAIVPPSELAAGTPPALEEAIMSCLALRPEYRPASAAALARELAHALPEAPTRPLHEPAETAATQVLSRRSRFGRHRRRLVVAALAALLLMGLALGLVISAGGDGGPRAVRPARVPATTAARPTQPTTAPSGPTAFAARPAQPPTCASIDRRKQQLEARKRAIDAQQRQTKHEARHDALEQEKRGLERQKHALDERRKDCR